MGNRILVRGVVAIVAAVALVFVIVYATNRDRFARRESASSGEGLTLEAEGEETAYGMQIGSNLKAFLYDEEFFDRTGETAEPYIEETGTSLSPRITAEDNVIVIRVTDTEGRVITGESFSVSVTKTDGGERTTQLTFVDDDMDGTIRSSVLTDGAWEVTLRPLAGYLVPPTGTTVHLGDYGEEEAEEEAEDDDADDAATDASDDTRTGQTEDDVSGDRNTGAGDGDTEDNGRNGTN